MPAIPYIVDAIARGLDVSQEEGRALLARISPVIEIAGTGQWWQNDSLTDRPACGWAAATAVAGENPHVFLENPLANGSDCLVERIFMINTTAADRTYEIILSDAVQLAAESPAYATTLRSWRDLRGLGAWDATNPTQRPSCRTGFFTRVGQIDGPRAMFVNDETSNHWGFPLEFPCILPPGTNVSVVQFAVNTALKIGFFWRELRIPR